MIKKKFSHPGVQAFWVGKTLYTYHRKTKTKIGYPPFSPAFAQEVERLDALVAEKGPRGARLSLESTLGWLIGQYRASPEFTGLGARTRKDYDDIFHWLRPLNEEPLSRFDGPEIIAIRNKAYAKKKRTFANYTVRVLSLLFNWGLLNGKALNNPAAKVPKIDRPKTLPVQNRRWAEGETEIVMAEALAQFGYTGVTVILGLCVYHAMREQDAVAFKRPGYNGKTLSWTTLKTGEELEGVPVDPRMKAILDSYLKVERVFVSPVLAVNHKGHPYTISGFLTQWQRFKTRLEQTGKIAPGLTIHGLRHTAGAALAEMGFDPRAIANHLGDKSLAMGKLYSDQAGKQKSRQATTAALRRKPVATPENENESARATDKSVKSVKE